MGCHGRWLLRVVVCYDRNVPYRLSIRLLCPLPCIYKLFGTLPLPAGFKGEWMQGTVSKRLQDGGGNGITMVSVISAWVQVVDSIPICSFNREIWIMISYRICLGDMRSKCWGVEDAYKVFDSMKEQHCRCALLVSVTGASFLNTFLPSMRSDKSPMKFNCTDGTVVKCPTDPQVATKNFSSSVEACPEYFKWIHEDLRPWKDTGITKDMVESAKKRAYIRIVVLNGRVYVKKFTYVFETRDVFTIWGILQLLRLYPGQIPDLDIMFEMGDSPAIKQSVYPRSKKIPVMFHYCGSDSTYDITFPDWSFWGWPEVNVKPWETFRKELEEGNHRVNWKDREPYAYWRGNALNPVRRNLLRCNLSEKPDSGALVYQLDWQREREGNFQHTDYAKQCTHRYKIYAEGNAWSVSEKYILACDSMSLFITPHYYDFFTRSLIPTIHYWPVNEKDECRSIKFAVDWGNNDTQKTQEIGKAGSKFLQEELQMKHVYDYMFHLLYNYGKLLKYTPTVPEGAVQYCLDSMTCTATGKVKEFLIDSMVKGPVDTGPCILPQPYDSAALQDFFQQKANLTKQVEKWEAGQSK